MNALGTSPATTLLALICTSTVLFSTNAVAQVQPKAPVTNVLLVHGAWVDGSSWAKVIPALESKGLNVVSVQIPLTSLADDVAPRSELLLSRTVPCFWSVTPMEELSSPKQALIRR
jgi:hypothetical protein